jgi:transposase
LKAEALLKMITPELQAEILSLKFAKKFGTRRISKLLKVNRKTVRCVIASRAVNLSQVRRKRGSIIDAYKGQIIDLVTRAPDISMYTIFMRIKESGYVGGYTAVRCWVKAHRVLNARPREAFLTLEFKPGECAQVDWGEFNDVFGDGVKVHCFLMVLCHSRLLYVEFTRSEKFEEFIRCHENAFKYFGNLVPDECWYDNLKTAVIDRMGKLVRFNARFLAYMGHHGIRPYACNPARGNEKGRVESAVKYVRSSFWAGREFKDFDDVTEQARHWLDTTANKRVHYSTRKVPILSFECEEKNKLRPMNPNEYDTDEIITRVVAPNFHIVYDTNKYSVPWTLVGLSITVRVNNELIKFFYNEQKICEHVRKYTKYQMITTPDHLKGLLERKPGALRSNWQLNSLKGMAPEIKKYMDLTRSGSRSVKSEVARLIALITVYGEEAVSKACGELLKISVMGVENLELTLKSKTLKSDLLLPKPLNFQSARLNRIVPVVDLRRFDALLFGSTFLNNASENAGEKDGSDNDSGDGSKVTKFKE